jgi:peptide/nickel transport system substrate-binding protein
MHMIFPKRRSGSVATALLALSLTAYLSTACTANPTGTSVSGSARSQEVIFQTCCGFNENPKNFNPFLPDSIDDQGLVQAAIEPLFLLNLQTGKVIPWLATSMTSSPDLTEWTMNLRPGVKWSDGVPFTAADVVFTMQMLLSHPELVGSGALSADVKSVSQVNNLTVRFELKHPDPRFELSNFTSQVSGDSENYIMPKHIWQGKNPLTFTDYDPAKGWPVTTGPYKLKSTSTTTTVWTRDDNWWGAKVGFMPLPKPKTLIWEAFGTQQAATQELADNQIDSIQDIDEPTYVSLQKQNPDVEAWQTNAPYLWEDPCELNLEVNNTVAPWNSPQMRWALDYAIDRNAIVSEAYNGATQTSISIYPAYPPLLKYVQLAQQSGLYNQYPLMTHDVSKAKQIFESQGYVLKGNFFEKDGKPLSLVIEEDQPTPQDVQDGEVVAQQLQAAGINATTHNVTENTWINDYDIGDFQAQVTNSTCNSVVEPWTSLDTLNDQFYVKPGKSTQWGFNGVRFNNAQYSQVVDQLGVQPLDSPQVNTLFLKAWTIFLKELPVIPLIQNRKIIPFDTKYWTGWPTLANPYIQPPSWWQSTHLILEHLQPATH